VSTELICDLNINFINGFFYSLVRFSGARVPNDSGIVSLLKTKLAHLDQDCESEARATVNELHSSIKYEGGRLRVPDFQQVANLMAGVIYCKEKRFNSEISRVLSASGGFRHPDEVQHAKELVAVYFQAERYLKRFEGFVESVEQAASRYGLKFDRQAYRIDLASSLFEVGVKNSTRRALASVQAELALHLHDIPLTSEGTVPGVNDIVDLKPNVMGFGINVNALIKRLWANYRK
jgi:hypothetical protein